MHATCNLVADGPWRCADQREGAPPACIGNRPNPVGLHRARIVARDGLRSEVDALEAIDGTPVTDVKPAFDPPS